MKKTSSANRHFPFFIFHSVFCFLFSGFDGFAALAAVPATNAPPGEILQTDSLGRVVKVTTNQLNQSLLPRGDLQLRRQLPATAKGTSMSDEALKRTQEERAGKEALEFFPTAPPRLMPYLASQDEFGNTAGHPGALISVAPLESLVQGAKTALSDIGLRYSLQQTFTYVNMTDVSGSSGVELAGSPTGDPQSNMWVPG